MHGEEHYTGGEGLAVANLGGEVVEGREIDAAQAETDGGEVEDRAPEFFARIGERGDDESSGTKRSGGLGSLIKASSGHDAIVVCGGGKLQMMGSDSF